MRFTNDTVKAFEDSLINRGYKKYKQNYRREDYMYWKSFERDEDNRKGYSVGFAFYDWNKYPQYSEFETYSVALHFLLGNDLGIDRLDVDITDDKMTVEEFEEFCAELYKFYLTTEISKHTDEN